MRNMRFAALASRRPLARNRIACANSSSHSPSLSVVVGSLAKSRQWAIQWIFVPLVVLIGCQGPNYKAVVTSPDAGAIVRAQQRNDHDQVRITVSIERVDGHYRYPGGRPAPLSSVLVDPGMRTLTVVGWEESKKMFYLDQSTANLQVTLRAGHVYAVKAERNGDEMIFWVEDEEDAGWVGDRQTAKVKTVHGPMGLFF